jgi:predicted ArsR family transcriptional regulator
MSLDTQEGSVSDDSELSTVVGLLDDEYARAILTATSDEAMSATELAEVCDISTSTAYRRLERLEEAGLVEPTMTYDADGYHRKEFRATLRSATVTLDGGNVDATVDVTESDTDRRR